MCWENCEVSLARHLTGRQIDALLEALPEGEILNPDLYSAVRTLRLTRKDRLAPVEMNTVPLEDPTCLRCLERPCICGVVFDIMKQKKGEEPVLHGQAVGADAVRYVAELEERFPDIRWSKEVHKKD